MDATKYELIQIKRILAEAWSDACWEIFRKLIKRIKKCCELHSTAFLLPACCLQFELFPILSTTGSLYSHEHTRQSEINVLSLGNTQEMVSFIVLSPSDNCFAMAPQMRKLWVCVKVWATGYVYARARACAASIHCNVFSNNHFVNCFSVASFSLCFQKTANSQCDLTKTYVEILRLPSIMMFEDWFCCFCLHAYCSVANCVSP